MFLKRTSKADLGILGLGGAVLHRALRRGLRCPRPPHAFNDALPDAAMRNRFVRRCKKSTVGQSIRPWPVNWPKKSMRPRSLAPSAIPKAAANVEPAIAAEVTRAATWPLKNSGRQKSAKRIPGRGELQSRHGNVSQAWSDGKIMLVERKSPWDDTVGGWEAGHSGGSH